jgi:hypothetical protein
MSPTIVMTFTELSRIEKRSTPEAQNSRENEFRFSIHACAKHIDGDSNNQCNGYPNSRADRIIPETNKDCCSTEFCG